MNIGDRVRILHGTEEGIVTRIVDNKTLEIEVEDGFNIPVLISDVVKVEDKEDKYFGEEVAETGTAPKKQAAETGTFVTLTLENKTNDYKIYIINNTDNDQLCAVFRKDGSLKFSGIFRSLVKSRSAIEIRKIHAGQLSDYNDLYFQIIIFRAKSGPLQSPVERHIRINKLLSKDPVNDIPVLGGNGWSRQIDDVQKEIKAEPESTSDFDQPLISNEFDLHAEALGLEEEKMFPTEILEAQLSAFNNTLDMAIVQGMREITFIHGVGAGTLKKKLIQEIRKRKEVRFWEDAQKEKFGYGATKIVL